MKRYQLTLSLFLASCSLVSLSFSPLYAVGGKEEKDEDEYAQELVEARHIAKKQKTGNKDENRNNSMKPLQKMPDDQFPTEFDDGFDFDRIVNLVYLPGEEFSEKFDKLFKPKMNDRFETNQNDGDFDSYMIPNEVIVNILGYFNDPKDWKNIKLLNNFFNPMEDLVLREDKLFFKIVVRKAFDNKFKNPDLAWKKILSFCASSQDEKVQKATKENIKFLRKKIKTFAETNEKAAWKLAHKLWRFAGENEDLRHVVRKLCSDMAVFVKDVGIDSAQLFETLLSSNPFISAVEVTKTTHYNEFDKLMGRISLNNQITKLRFDNISIKDDEAHSDSDESSTENDYHNLVTQRIADTLQNHPTLKIVDINNIDEFGMGDLGFKPLTQMLKNNSKIEVLYLNPIEACLDNEDAANFAEVISENKTLRKFGVYGGAFEGKALAKALEANTTLTHCLCIGTLINTDGAFEIVKALKNNTTLKHLNLQANYIGAEGLWEFVELLKVNKTLKSLCLQGQLKRIDNQVCEDGWPNDEDVNIPEELEKTFKEVLIDRPDFKLEL